MDIKPPIESLFNVQLVVAGIRPQNSLTGDDTAIVDRSGGWQRSPALPNAEEEQLTASATPPAGGVDCPGWQAKR